MPTCRGLTLRQRFPYILGTTSGFNLHPVQERTSPHPTQNIMTLTLTFAPKNQNILAWATLHFAILHHCINSVLSCSQNTHFTQGPKSDYTHAYNHSLFKPLVMPIAFLEPVSFFLINFPGLYPCPIASNKLAAHYLNFHLNVAL